LIDTLRFRTTLAALILLGAASSCSDAPGSGGSSGVVLAQPPTSEQSFGEVGPFSLTERSGAPISRDDLLGKPWIAAFVFTRCTGPCPRITSTMAKLQQRLRDTSVRLVSFSVDPEWDTPQVLREYADAAGADKDRWLFVTGDERVIYDLIRTSFLSPVERAPANEAAIGMQVSHRTQLVTVDAKGKIRGFYDGETDAALDQVVDRVRFLERESAAPDAR
jgi:cytochrome oxidase Cu insertion factor (SCO1/SenC/PrrC family)